MRRGQIVEGDVRIAKMAPDVIRLDDNGKRKVTLKFGVDALVIEAELLDPEQLALEIIRASVWVSEGKQ